MKFLGCWLLLSTAAWADGETFHGWSKDGSWLVLEQHALDDRTEIHFCVTESTQRPTWPPTLNDMDREDGALSCVRFLDPNKAPYQWKNLLTLPPPSQKQNGISISSELSTDGETPGFVLTMGDKTQVCYASGTREDSKLQKSWFHPTGRYVGVLIDGNFHHCVVALKASKAPPSKPVKAGKKK